MNSALGASRAAHGQGHFSRVEKTLASQATSGGLLAQFPVVSEIWLQGRGGRGAGGVGGRVGVGLGAGVGKGTNATSCLAHAARKGGGGVGGRAWPRQKRISGRH